MNNKERAQEIAYILDEEFDLNNGNDEPEAVGDILTNILHYCELEGVDFNDRLRMARMHFEEELIEEAVAECIYGVCDRCGRSGELGHRGAE